MEELTKALELIKKTCMDYDNCAICLLGSKDEDCLILQSEPNDWKIANKQIVRLLE